MHDLVIRGGTLVQPHGIERADIGIENGQIVAIDHHLSGPTRQEVDAAALYVCPGVIDVHVHFNEPGRTHWEGGLTGSQALVAGGGTLFFDMPLNSTPPVVNRATFEAKRSALEAVAVTDFGLWGGLVPGNITALEAMAEAGAVGFKAFMCDSGLAEFPAVNEHTLLQGMKVAKEVGLPVAVHAESETVVRALTAQVHATGGRDVHAYLASRTAIAEETAVRRALFCAGETGARLHIVHVSTGRSVAHIVEARKAGIDVTLESCPHYLLFTATDLEQVGALLKSAPPLRHKAEQEALWQAILAEQVDMIASDHSPAPPEMKQGDDFFAIWGGIAGVQSTLPALLTGLQARTSAERAVSLAAKLLSANPARCFGIQGKGSLAVGHDADLALVALQCRWHLQPQHLMQRHPLSPYCGREFLVQVRATFARGKRVFADGIASEERWGRFVRPAHR